MSRSTLGTAGHQDVPVAGAPPDHGPVELPREPDRERPLRQRKPMSLAERVASMLLILLASTLAAAAISAAQPPTYAAQADILYRGSDTEGVQDLERAMATQQVLLQSQPLMTAAAEAVGRTPRELARDTTVDVVEQSNVLRLVVRDRDPEGARVAASRLVQAYIDLLGRQSAVAQTGEQERQLLQARLDDVNHRLGELLPRIGELSAVPEPSAAQQAQQRALEAEAQVLRQRTAALEGELLDVDVRTIQEETNRARLLADPFVLDEPVSPQPVRAAAAGLLLGVVLVVALEASLRVLRQRWERRAE